MTVSVRQADLELRTSGWPRGRPKGRPLHHALFPQPLDLLATVAEGVEHLRRVLTQVGRRGGRRGRSLTEGDGAVDRRDLTQPRVLNRHQVAVVVDLCLGG